MCRIEKKDRSNPLFTLAGAGEKYHKRSRSRQASFISHPLSLPVAEGICLSQISLAWKKKISTSCIPQTVRENTVKAAPKRYRRLIQRDVSTHSSDYGEPVILTRD